MSDVEPEIDSDSAPLLLEHLLQRAVRSGATDLHVQKRRQRVWHCYRLDGALTPAIELTEPSAERLVGRIKYLAKMRTYLDDVPQDGRIEAADVGLRSDVRVAAHPTVDGEKIVLRLFPQTAGLPLEELGIPDAALADLVAFLEKPAGLLLLTGPAGSGKTTTIYGCLRRLAQSGARHVVTIEDPVEQILPGITQTEVNEARGLSFASAARRLLRHDPEVLMIGEIRDAETANLAVQSAFTGHLVLATLHAGSCREVCERLVGLSGDAFAAAAALDLVVNQRLIRQKCESCRGEGCEVCYRTGFHGRVLSVEWARIDETARAALRMRDSGKLACRSIQPDVEETGAEAK